MDELNSPQPQPAMQPDEPELEGAGSDVIRVPPADQKTNASLDLSEPEPDEEDTAPILVTKPIHPPQPFGGKPVQEQSTRRMEVDERPKPREVDTQSTRISSTAYTNQLHNAQTPTPSTTGMSRERTQPGAVPGMTASNRPQQARRNPQRGQSQGATSTQYPGAYPRRNPPGGVSTRWVSARSCKHGSTDTAA